MINSRGGRLSMTRGPDVGLEHIVVFMPVYIARARDAVPRDGWVSGIHVLAHTTRGLEYDFQASDDGIDALAIFGECEISDRLSRPPPQLARAT